MVSRDNVLIVAIGTITVTIVGGLLSDVFSPLTEHIKDILSPPPDTNISLATTFDSSRNNVNKSLNPGETIAARAVNFFFDSKRGWINPFLFFPSFNFTLLPVNSSSTFECSFDGLPFEECLSPKHYANLQTEEGHTFKVRVKGILGNKDKSPATFSFTTITSSSVREL